jgi:hypothetical protein
LVHFGRPLNVKFWFLYSHLVYLPSLWPFALLNGNLVYFAVIWHIVWRRIWQPRSVSHIYGLLFPR